MERGLKLVTYLEYRVVLSGKQFGATYTGIKQNQEKKKFTIDEQKISVNNGTCIQS